MANIDFLPPQLKQFAETQAAAGGYSDVLGYLSDLVRKDLNQQDQLHLEQLLLEGLEGEGEEVTPAFWEKLREKARKLDAQRSHAGS